MQKKITSALISVFYKDGLAPIVEAIHAAGVTIYSTGGTQQFIETLGIPCVAVESITGFPSILGGRVKTLHPSVFGAILGRRYEPQDIEEMETELNIQNRLNMFNDTYNKRYIEYIKIIILLVFVIICFWLTSIVDNMNILPKSILYSIIIIISSITFIYIYSIYQNILIHNIIKYCIIYFSSF